MSNTFQIRSDGSLVEIAEDGTAVGVVSPMPQRPDQDEPAPAAKPKAVAKPEPLRTSRDVVKAAKARVKEIRAELRHHEQLKREAAQLDRLIAAATSKPLATVRDLKRSAS